MATDVSLAQEGDEETARLPNARRGTAGCSLAHEKLTGS
jgi:hypothetical protein